MNSLYCYTRLWHRDVAIPCWQPLYNRAGAYVGLSLSGVLLISLCLVCICWACRTRVDEDEILVATRKRVTKHSGRNAKMGSEALNITKCASIRLISTHLCPLLGPASCVQHLRECSLLSLAAAQHIGDREGEWWEGVAERRTCQGPHHTL